MFDPKSIYSDTIPLKIIFGSVAGPMFTLETLENQHSFLCMFAFAEGVACFPAVLILNKGVHTVGTVLYVFTVIKIKFFNRNKEKNTIPPRRILCVSSIAEYTVF